jgi:predicted  nucleic acid-binding Zn-ribbon protein
VERLMGAEKHERFVSANDELRDFLHRVEGLASGTCSIGESDLQSLSQRLSNLAPEIGDASRGETLDADLQNEIAKYVKNLRALQTALEKVRCFMLARKMQLEAEKRHLDGLQGWVNAYNQTT